LNIGTVTDAVADFGYRMEGIKYTTPTFAGFVANASIGESLKVQNNYNSGAFANPATDREYNGQVYGANLLYAGEFSGVRLAAGIGYERSEQDSGANTNGTTAGNNYQQRVQQYGGSLSGLHVPTGLFLQGDYFISKRAAVVSLDPVSFSQVYGADVEARRFIIQGGISQNFFGPGKTVLFGEYGKHTNWAEANAQNANPASTGLPGTAATFVTSGGTNTFYGLGAVQNFDAAALELYAGWRRYSTSNVTGASTINGSAASFLLNDVAIKDVDVVAAGARIKF
jgi:hypothetical protein